MTDTPQAPDWLPFAQDRLREVGLNEAAEWLDAFAELLPMMEAEVASSIRAWRQTAAIDRVIAIIAKACGETVERVVARLSPPGTSGVMHVNGVSIPVSDVRYGYRVESDWSDARNATPLGDQRALQERMRRDSTHFTPRLPGPPEADPDPVTRPVTRRGLADYVRPRVAGGHNAPARSRRRSNP